MALLAYANVRVSISRALAIAMHILVLSPTSVEPRALADPPCAAVPTFVDALQPAFEIHVAPGGSDQTGDGSVARPYATIQVAASHARPGSAIRIHAGVFSGGVFLSNLRGRIDAPIWIGAADKDHRPVLEGGSQGLHLTRCAFVVVHDLEIRNVTSNGINSDDGGDRNDPDAAHHQVFRSLFIHDVGGSGNQDGLKLSGVRHFVVDGCEITRCGGAMSGSGIDMVGCHAGVIARCSLHDLSANAVQAKGGTADVEVKWCRMVEAGERALNIGGSTGLEFFRPPLSVDEPNAEARNVRVVANLIIGASTPVAFVGAVDCEFAQNTVVAPRRWLMRILQETTSTPEYEFLPSSNNTFASNIVWFARSSISAHINIGSGTAPETFIFANNLWYAYDNPSASRPSFPSPEANGIAGVDPLFRGPAVEDYAICTASPAASAGRLPLAVEGDRSGACYQSPPAIGAYEATSGPRADINRDGRVDSQDFFDYLVLFFAQDPAGDFNDNGSVTSEDFFDFLREMLVLCVSVPRSLLILAT